MTRQLIEWGSQAGVELSPDQVQTLARSKAFGVRPDPDVAGHWVLSASQYVGVAHFGDLELRVKPKVSVHQLLELLCTSIGRIAWSNKTRGGVRQTICSSLSPHRLSFTLNASFGMASCRGTTSATNGSLVYTVAFALSRQVTRNPGLPLPIEVTYDEYTPDVMENQLLAGATQVLLRLPKVPSDIRARLRRLHYQLIDITPSRPSRSPPDVVWTRLNNRYRFTVTLARLVLRSARSRTVTRET